MEDLSPGTDGLPNGVSDIFLLLSFSSNLNSNKFQLNFPAKLYLFFETEIFFCIFPKKYSTAKFFLNILFDFKKNEHFARR
jgi:hypothetical protein